MAFWCRVKNSNLKNLSIHLKRCYFECHSSNLLIASASHPLARVLSNSSLTIPKSPFEFSQSVRCFAAPVQAKTRKEEKDTSGPRLNREIRADVVRLVDDNGQHRIMSIREAFEIARSLNLDLVEVARDSKPPVCRIMDYHKEKYKQQMKESAKKNKSELTLKGDCKEVRFVGKIEKKDLQIKADTVKRLMERGYRVKCTAMSKGKEVEDLGAVLSRFCPLIEDVAYVESAPRVEKKQAYIVVRHVKFGPSKKGSGMKALKECNTAISAEDSNKSASVAPESFLQSKQNCDTSESSIENDDNCMEAMTAEDVDIARSGWIASSANGDSDKVFDFAEGEKEGAKRPGSANVSSDLASVSSGGKSSFRRESGNTLHGPSGGENRYRRDPRSRSTKMADTVSDLGNQLPLDRSTSSHTRDLGSQFPGKFPEQHISQPIGQSSPSCDFGIFSCTQADRTPGNENNVAAQNRYKKREQFNSSASDPRGLPMANAQARRPDLGRKEDGQGKFPIFGSSANMKPNQR